MRLHEYVANRIFQEHGIPMANGYVVSSSGELRDFEGKIVLKAQVLTGGRGKAGGIQFASSIKEARNKLEDMFNSRINGLPVREIFVQAAFDVLKEYYIGFTIDRQEKKAVLLISPSGGIDVEESSQNKELGKLHIDPIAGLKIEEVEETIQKVLGRNNDFIVGVAEKLYAVFIKHDAIIAEINPLAKTPHGFVGLDSKLTIDDNSLFRHKDLAENEDKSSLTDIELKARKSGLSYVELEGNIGVIGCGAGLVMASLDSLRQYGGKPANFLDVGGGASKETMERAIDLALKKPGIKSLFINMFAGITRCDEIAKAIIAKKPKVPLSIRMMGTREKEGKKLLEKNGYSVYDSMQGAAKYAVEKSR